MGQERARPEFLGQSHDLPIGRFSPLDLQGIAMCGDLTEEPQGPRLGPLSFVVTGELKGTCPKRMADRSYLQGCSCLHAVMRQVWPISPPSHPGKAQSSTILGSTTTSIYTSKRGMISKFSNL